MRNDAEPPSLSRSEIFMVGQDGRGNWVVQDLTGTRGGLFVDRAQALRYVRSENGSHRQAFVAFPGILELDMSQKPSKAPLRQLDGDGQRERRVA